MALIKLNNKAVSNATVIGSISSLGSMTFIKKLTASGSATLSFVDGASGVVLDDTYKEYYFTFNNIHPATNSVNFTFNMSIDTGSNYNVTKTTTFFSAYHEESGASSSLGYITGDDLAQSTAFQNLSRNTKNDADATCSGSLTLFNPSSTTFVKHFTSRNSGYNSGNLIVDDHIAGYGNTTSAVDAIQFKMSSGNLASGDICLYGIA